MHVACVHVVNMYEHKCRGNVLAHRLERTSPSSPAPIRTHFTTPLPVCYVLCVYAAHLHINIKCLGCHNNISFRVYTLATRVTTRETVWMDVSREHSFFACPTHNIAGEFVRIHTSRARTQTQNHHQQSVATRETVCCAAGCCKMRGDGVLVCRVLFVWRGEARLCTWRSRSRSPNQT